MSMSRLVLAPYDPERDRDVRELFEGYLYKDHQLRFIGVAKERMVCHLEKTLDQPGIQAICLRDEGKPEGMIALQDLPWMSKHFGLRMYAVRHLPASSDNPLVRPRLLRYVMEELPDVDFLDCRVAVDDVNSAHALEICGFRYVGSEIYMGRQLEPMDPPEPHPDFDIAPRSRSERRQVLDIGTETHVNNRFVYDPIIRTRAAKSLYGRLVENCFDHEHFNVLVARARGSVQGFINSKVNQAFSNAVGRVCGSLSFIGVRPGTRNRGIGVALNERALYEMAGKGATYAAVRTLAVNYAALATCYRTGFKVTSSSLHFHRWIQRPARTYKPVEQAVDQDAVTMAGCAHR